MKRKIIDLIIISLLLLLFGCQTNNANIENIEENNDNGHIVFVVKDSSLNEMWDKLEGLFEIQNDFSLDIIKVDKDDYNDYLEVNLGYNGSSITMFELDGYLDFYRNGYYCYKFNDTDIYNMMMTHSFDLIKSYADYGIAFDFDSVGLIVNKELLNIAGYEIEDIQDYSSFKDIVKDIHYRYEELGFDSFAPIDLVSNYGHKYITYLPSIPIFYEETKFNKPITGSYLDEYQNIFDLLNDNCLYEEYTDISINNELIHFANNDCVFYFGGSREYNDLIDLLKNDTTNDNYDVEDLSDDILDEFVDVDFEETNEELYLDENIDVSLEETVIEDLNLKYQIIPLYCGHVNEESYGLLSGGKKHLSINFKSNEKDLDATIAFTKWLISSSDSIKIMKKYGLNVPSKDYDVFDNPFIQETINIYYHEKLPILYSDFCYFDDQFIRHDLITLLQDYCDNGDWDTFIDKYLNSYNSMYLKQ